MKLHLGLTFLPFPDSFPLQDPGLGAEKSLLFPGEFSLFASKLEFSEEKWWDSHLTSSHLDGSKERQKGGKSLHPKAEPIHWKLVFFGKNGIFLLSGNSERSGLGSRLGARGCAAGACRGHKLSQSSC